MSIRSKTELLDQLFLELSQVTTKKTYRQIYLEEALKDAKGILTDIKSELGSDSKYGDIISVIDIFIKTVKI